MTTPTTRTLKKLTEDSWLAETVEKWIPRTRITRDLFGVGDILAVKHGEVVLIQATSDNTGGNSPSRIAKIKAEPRMHQWLHADILRVQVWAWRFLKRSGQWEPKITEITFDDLDPLP